MVRLLGAAHKEVGTLKRAGMYDLGTCTVAGVE